VAEPLEFEHLADGEYADGPGAAPRGEGGTRADLRITVALKCWSGAAKRQTGLFA
jgi:hypothetical protein